MEAETPTPAPSQETPAAPVLTAAEAAVADNDFSRFQEATYAEAKGEPLAPPAPVAATPVLEDDAEPAPTPERPVSKRQQQINDYERRIAEQTERIARLEAQAKPTESKPEPKAAVAPPEDPEPKFEDFATEADPYTAHLKATARWEARQEFKAAQQKADAARQQTQAESAQRETARGWKTKVDAASEKHPDFKAVALERPTAIVPGSVADGWILDSPHGAEVLYALQSNQAEQQRILALPAYQQIRALVALEDQLTAPVTKTISSAPTPPATVGARVVDPGDPITEAVANDDFRRFQAATFANAAAGRR